MPLEKGASKEAPFLLPRESAAFFAPTGRGGQSQRGSAASLFPRKRGRGERRARRDTKGGILFSKRTPPLNPPEKDEGSPPRPPTLAVRGSKSCTRCAIGCGVHGFAMNPYYSPPIATAPYCREARVTLPWRQTACRMRHCFARRIDGTGGRRELGCTPTRWAERQRIIGVGQIV